MSNKNIIWTTDNCPFCTKAKALMDKNDIKYEVRLVDDVKWTLNDLLNFVPDARTYPQVFLEDKHIGGCDDLEAHFTLKEMGINGL